MQHSGEDAISMAVGVDLYNGEITGDIAATLSAESCITSSRNGPYVLIFDARGNGGGAICPTITGGHMGHANDYMAVVVTYEDIYREPIRRLPQDGEKQ